MKTSAVLPPKSAEALTQPTQQRWLNALIASVGPALAGLLVAVTMPRGPATSAQALAVMALGFAVGLGAGYVLRSRWAMLLAPAVHIIAIELVRLPVIGPTEEERMALIWVYSHTGSALIAQLMYLAFTGIFVTLQPQLIPQQTLTYDAAIAGALWVLVALLALVIRRPMRTAMQSR